MASAVPKPDLASVSAIIVEYGAITRDAGVTDG